ncbi:MAG TPA: hypothetical protein VIO94_01215 [Phenylobacterium sp.]
MTDVMAAKKTTTKGKKAAVSAKLRAMVEDVERWPLPTSLLQMLDEMDAAEAPADPKAAANED